MKPLTPFFFLALAGLLPLQAADTAPDLPNREIPALDPFKALRLADIAPKTAKATPKKPRLVLVCARTEGYYHESIPLAIGAVEAIGASSGAFKVEFNHEMSAFTAENLKRFDAVIFVNSTQLKFQNPEHRKALLDYVKNGGGLVGIHAASDNFPGWLEGQALMGGVFHSHPWRNSDVVAVKLDEPGHILNEAFHGKGFWIQEEIYQIVGAYSRSNQRVLMSLDMSRKENDRPADQFASASRDFPIGWLKHEGTGRVFYSSLGHNETTFFTPEVLQHYLDGIQFAVGDLDADALPTASLPKAPVPALAPDDHHVLLEASLLSRIESADTIDALVSYEEGKSFDALNTVASALRAADTAARLRFEARLVAAATAKTPGAEARREISKWLGWSGSDASVGLLTSWAKMPEAADDAVNALCQLWSPLSEKALVSLAALPPSRLTISALNALREKHSGAAVSLASELVKSKDETIAAAALSYLANAAVGSGAGVALTHAQVPESLAPLHLRSMLQYIHRAFEAEKFWSLDMLRTLAKNSKYAGERRAAAFELLTLNGEEGLIETLPFFTTFDELHARSLAAAWVRQAVSTSATKAISTGAAAFATLPKPVQVQVLTIAEQVGSPSLLPLVDAGMAVADTDVSKLAIAALGSSGRDLATADRLLALLAKPETAREAEGALSRLRCAELNAKIEELASKAEGASLTSLLTIGASRVDRSLMPYVLKAAAGTGEPRKAAFKAMASLVRGEDLDLLLNLRKDLKTGLEKRAWQDAFFTSVRFRSDKDAVVEIIKSQLPTAQEYERTAFVISVTLLDVPSGAAAVKAELASPDVERRKEILRALSSARNLAAADLLIDHIETAKDENETILGLRGYLDTLSAFQEMNMPKKVKGYRRAYACATRAEEKNAIAATVQNLWGPDAAKFAAELNELKK